MQWDQTIYRTNRLRTYEKLIKETRPCIWDERSLNQPKGINAKGVLDRPS